MQNIKIVSQEPALLDAKILSSAAMAFAPKMGANHRFLARFPKTAHLIFASAMQIGSPSKLFESFGEFTLEGYMIGVKKKLPESIKLIDSWGDDISNAYNANTMGMSGNIDISASSSEFAGTIINGVYEAVAAAMENHSQEVTVYSELRTDDEALARAVTRGQKSLNRRYKTV